MATFNIALPKVLAREGGYVNDPQDPGGETYKGVSRKIHSKWQGWAVIDSAKKQAGFPSRLDSDFELQQMLEDFYRINFWDRIQGDMIENQEVAESIFDFAVNAGVGTSATLAQMVVGVESDGVIGKDSLAAINSFDTEHFFAAFTVAKIARYVTIVKKRPTSRKYFYGWVLRALGEEG